MKDDTAPYSSPNFDPDSDEPSGSLRRALYLWERQPPAASRPVTSDIPIYSQNAEAESAPPEKASQTPSFNMSAPADTAIEEILKAHAARLSVLERVIPGDRRLDSPRFSLMMLNAFLGRAVTDGALIARLPGLFAISDRIEAELSDLEHEYPDALATQKAEPDPTPALIRDEMRRFFADLSATQKSQQRQIATSLAALHTAINELRTRLPDRDRQREQNAGPLKPEETLAARNVPRDDLARPLIDSERLVDPRPVLAAARAAASRANLELADSFPKPETDSAKAGLPEGRPYKSVLLGSAVLGLLMILFGRDAVQLISSTSLHQGLARP